MLGVIFTDRGARHEVEHVLRGFRGVELHLVLGLSLATLGLQNRWVGRVRQVGESTALPILTPSCRAASRKVEKDCGRSPNLEAPPEVDQT
jgi:hypothetical protein